MNVSINIHHADKIKAEAVRCQEIKSSWVRLTHPTVDVVLFFDNHEQAEAVAKVFNNVRP